MSVSTVLQNGHTPLHRAMIDGHVAVLKILVDAGCSLDIVDEVRLLFSVLAVQYVCGSIHSFCLSL